MTNNFTCGILTVSDKGARGERVDTSGSGLKLTLEEMGYRIMTYAVIPDEQEIIEATLMEWIDVQKIDLVVSTGGTGLSPRDVTPEATRAVIDREIPGMSEAMRQMSLAVTPYAMLSRSVCGTRNKSLIINLPGSAKASAENLKTVLPVLLHALYKIKGGTDDCV